MSWTPLGQVVYAFAPVAHLRASLQASIWTWAQVAISPGFNNQGRDLTTTPPSCLNYSYQTCQFRPQLSGNCTVAHAHLHLQALIVTSSQSPRVAIFVALHIGSKIRTGNDFLFVLELQTADVEKIAGLIETPVESTRSAYPRILANVPW
ncbi:predicted protein [Histoplasma capsulatum G186AR]|uniref:Uncharacterized protein n=1 Tax=Ajellomyces capsulatus (strain G186AR / H82 / ATCC MYA-2454 / RMSCC 2432) TaxID=447093 RepID=C0NQB9_AJECG|nr:uncharacterized protein HCBG_05707 [Histoplasma capsulatum G186AR]EEH06391.1 predicted protein [Histoplasma capsulatum G186AR]